MIKKMIQILAVLALTISVATAAEYSGIKMTNINVKNQGEVAHVAPGETFGVRADYEFLWPREMYSIVQIIVGLDQIGAQTCIANGLVQCDGQYYDHHALYFQRKPIDITRKRVDFALVAPEKPGTYEIRFRYAQAYLPDEAVTYWWNVDQAPTSEATIGTIIVE